MSGNCAWSKLWSFHCFHYWLFCAKTARNNAMISFFHDDKRWFERTQWKFWWGSRGRRRRKGVASVAAWSRTKWRWNSDMTNVLLERFRRAAVPHIHKEHRPSGWNVRRSRLAEAFASATGVWLTQPRLTTGLLFFFFFWRCAWCAASYPTQLYAKSGGTDQSALNRLWFSYST